MSAPATKRANKTVALPNEDHAAVHVPEPLVEYITAHCAMSVQALRLIYGLLLLGRSEGDDVIGTIRKLHALNKPYFNVPRAAIARHVAPPGANDARWMLKASDELMQTKLFAQIHPVGRSLQVKISKTFVDRCPSTEKEIRTTPFARIGSSDLMYRSRTAAILTRLQGNKMWPKFRLPKIAHETVEEACAERNVPMKISGLNGSMEERVERETARRSLLGIQSWRASRGVWLKAFHAIARDMEVGFLVMPVCDPWTDHVRTVEVKMAHHATKWGEGALFAGPAGVRSIYRVSARGVRTLTRKEWRGLAHQTRID
jgi:hypothetical protein